MTDFQKYALAFCVGFFFVVAGVTCFLLGRHAGRKVADFPVKVVTDTLVIRDTIREKYPVYETKYVTRTELVRVTDTVRVRDTLYQAVQIERKTYQGDDYQAVVSGWRPELEEISVFPKTIYLQTEVTQPSGKTGRQPRLGFGVTLGPSVIWVPGEGVKAGAGGSAGITIEF